MFLTLFAIWLLHMAATVTPGANTLLVLTVAMVCANALCWYGLLAFLFSRKRVQSAYGGHSAWLARTAGVVLGALGIQFVYRSFKEL